MGKKAWIGSGLGSALIGPIIGTAIGAGAGAVADNMTKKSSSGVAGSASATEDLAGTAKSQDDQSGIAGEVNLGKKVVANRNANDWMASEGDDMTTTLG